MDKREILIIEDDMDIRRSIRTLMEEEGYRVAEGADGPEGLKHLSADTTLVILDVMLPGMSGIQVCRRIRENWAVPILFLTAKDQEMDKLMGLKAGGDDYMVKPFSYAELSARAAALIRRYQVYNPMRDSAGTDTGEWLTRGELRLHTAHNQVLLRGREVELTEIEYRLLLIMASYPKKLFSAKNLYESVWEEPFFYSCSNTVMVHIRRLRQKIEEDPGNPKIIETVWGKGYRFGNP